MNPPPVIPYSRQSISEDDIAAVVQVLRGEWLTQGPAVGSFEEAIAKQCCAKHAVAVNSATSALHLACLALGVASGDWVWTSPISFVASSNCALYCGAEVDFVDIDPRTYNIDTTALEVKLAKAKTQGKLPKVVVAVHLCGQPCDMTGLHALSRRYGFRIIEDASHAVGASYLGEPVGNCRFSDITVFSFHPVKIITSAEGGMALTNDSRLAKRMASLRSHGITRDEREMSGPSHGPWYYEQHELGFNYRMTDMQAALGLSQLTRLQYFVDRRRALAKRYDQLLCALPCILPWQHPDGQSSWHLYVIRLRTEEIGLTHRQVFDEMRRHGIGVNLHYIPIHLQPYYRERVGCLELPHAERYYREAISLPLHVKLSHSEQNRVVTALGRALMPRSKPSMEAG